MRVATGRAIELVDLRRTLTVAVDEPVGPFLPRVGGTEYTRPTNTDYSATTPIEADPRAWPLNRAQKPSLRDTRLPLPYRSRGASCYCQLLGLSLAGTDNHRCPKLRDRLLAR